MTASTGSAPDPSFVRGVDAAPADYIMDVTKPVATTSADGVQIPGEGFRTVYSSDPSAPPAKMATADPDVRAMLEDMLLDIDTFIPERGRLVRDPNDPNSSIFTGGRADRYTGGSKVANDIRVLSGSGETNQDFAEAIKELLAGKTPSNRKHTAAIDAALGYLEGRSGYRKPQVSSRDFPSDDEIARLLAEGAARPDDADAFEEFSKFVDELGAGDEGAAIE